MSSYCSDTVWNAIASVLVLHLDLQKLHLLVQKRDESAYARILPLHVVKQNKKKCKSIVNYCARRNNFQND